jgi:hypothetical protein
MPEIGSNMFINCTVPIVFEGRYFVYEQQEEQDVFSVFTLVGGNPVFEILRNEPHENPLTDVIKYPLGFITVSDKIAGDLIYKVRLGHNGSSIFVKIEGEEMEMWIDDNVIIISGTVVERNSIKGEVGIVISEDGSLTMGSSLPQEARHLFAKRTNEKI